MFVPTPTPPRWSCGLRSCRSRSSGRHLVLAERARLRAVQIESKAPSRPHTVRPSLPLIMRFFNGRAPADKAAFTAPDRNIVAHPKVATAWRLGGAGGGRRRSATVVSPTSPSRQGPGPRHRDASPCPRRVRRAYSSLATPPPGGIGALAWKVGARGRLFGRSRRRWSAGWSAPSGPRPCVEGPLTGPGDDGLRSCWSGPSSVSRGVQDRTARRVGGCPASRATRNSSLSPRVRSTCRHCRRRVHPGRRLQAMKTVRRPAPPSPRPHDHQALHLSFAAVIAARRRPVAGWSRPSASPRQTSPCWKVPTPACR